MWVCLEGEFFFASFIWLINIFSYLKCCFLPVEHLWFLLTKSRENHERPWGSWGQGQNKPNLGSIWRTLDGYLLQTRGALCGSSASRTQECGTDAVHNDCCPRSLASTDNMADCTLAGRWQCLHSNLSFNSLWPGDDIWWHRSGSTLVQVMAWCLTAPSHYLHQCWLVISGVLWHLREV